MLKRRVDLVSLLTYATLIFTLVVVVLHFVFGFQYVVILTDSMEPNINPSDLVITMPVDPGELRPGDVILYEITLDNTTYRITHRIIAIERDPSGRIYFITKGDNRKHPDPWKVYPEQVIGKVILVIPKVGMVWYYTPLLVLLLFLIVIGSLAYDMALLLLADKPVRPKSRKADLLVIRRKKIKTYYYRR